jgi:Caspase domain
VAKRRGAVVVGVNKTGNLQPLESAADGAETFGVWLSSEGFEVKTITDKTGKVTSQQIQQAIESFVSAGNCHQLVIYFSGHGYWKNDAELWLLSDAPFDANAAVSWVETAEFAKDCGIPSVVMISDACRSIPTSPKDLRVRGSIVFPNDDVARSRAKVDKFMAAIVGTPAYEIPMGSAKKQSVFTHCFLQAFTTPDPELIKQISEDGVKIDVVPNRRLGKFLQRCMTATMATANVQYDPTPDAEVLSDEDVYIGKVRVLTALPKFSAAEPTARFRMRRKPDKPMVQLRDVAEAAVGRAMDSQVEISEPRAQALERLSKTSGFGDALNKAKTVAEISRFETQTGFAILGASIQDLAMGQGGRLDLVERGDARNPGVVRVHPTRSAQSVGLQFASGQGAVLAALRGYIGHVLVEDKSVMNVTSCGQKIKTAGKTRGYPIPA